MREIQLLKRKGIIFMKHLFKFVILFLCLVINLTAFANQLGYHDTDDKSAFWIPKDVNPLLKSNVSLEQYRIVTNIEKYKSNPFCKYYIEKAKQENRPVIMLDIWNANKDEKLYKYVFTRLHDIIACDGVDSVDSDGIGGLTTEIKILEEKYGENNEIFNEKFKRYVSIYIQQNEYRKTHKTAAQLKQDEENKKREEALKQQEELEQSLEDFERKHPVFTEVLKTVLPH